MSKVPEPKYDENGRPIKKGFVAFFSNNKRNNSRVQSSSSNMYKRSNFNSYDRELGKYEEDYKEKLENIDKKFYNSNPEDKINQIETRVIVPLFLGIFSLFMSIVGFFMAIGILIYYTNINVDKKKYEAIIKIGRTIALISLLFNGVILFVFLFVLFG